jgi:hypothetical protein
MRKFAIGLVLLGFLVAFAGQAFSADTYTVQKGDTLSGIAEKIFGDYKKWRELADLNGLKITSITIGNKTYDHVLISPGQVLKLRAMKKMTKEDATHLLQDVINSRIKTFRNPHTVDSDHALHQYRTAMVELSELDKRANRNFWYHVYIDYSHSGKKAFEHWIRQLRMSRADYEAHVIRETLIYAIIPAMQAEYTPKELVERVLQIMALIETESGYRNVRGQHGEVGWFQVKPATWLYYTEKLEQQFTPDEPPACFVNQTSEMMERDFVHACTWTSWLLRYLIKTEGGWFKAMERYNNGSEKTAYAHRVDRAYCFLNAMFYRMWNKEAIL